LREKQKQKDTKAGRKLFLMPLCLFACELLELGP
jgi:hypothetical protein